MTESAMRAAVDWLCPTFGSGPHVAGGGQAAHQCFPCCLRNPPIPEKKAAAGWLCAAALPKEGAQYYEYASYSCREPSSSHSLTKIIEIEPGRSDSP
jgi:hypothetical protein